jgi:hypothetical protein
MKKIDFGSKRPESQLPGNVDNWVQNREVTDREETKRLTIDVPISLHKRIKSQCAIENLVMADVIRELLEQRFPRPKDAAHPSTLEKVPS